MPIIILDPTENIFDYEAEAALVDPVNCQGFVGTLAAAFADRYGAALMGPYRRACRKGRLQPGGVMAIDTGAAIVLCAATKGKVQFPSTLRYIKDCVAGLALWGETYGYPLALPAIGCGAGGLEWEAVLPIIEAGLGHLPQTVYVFPPRDAA